MEFGEEEKDRTQACKDDGEHHDERSAATTLITYINAFFFFLIIKKHMFGYICGGKAYDENKLLYEHECLCA